MQILFLQKKSRLKGTVVFDKNLVFQSFPLQILLISGNGTLEHPLMQIRYYTFR
jgi:hypothetical protein